MYDQGREDDVRDELLADHPISSETSYDIHEPTRYFEPLTLFYECGFKLAGGDFVENIEAKI